MKQAEKLKKGVGAIAGVAMVATLSVGVPTTAVAAPAVAAASTSAQADAGATTVAAGLVTVKAADGTTVGTFDTLKQAIHDAAQGSVIVLNDNVHIAAQTDAAIVYKDLTLDLDGHTLSAPAFVHPLEATAGTLTITGDGYVEGGPALTVYNDASVVIENGTFTGYDAWRSNDGTQSSAIAIQVIKDAAATGAVAIKGGTFRVGDTRATWKVLLDQVSTDTTQRFEISGGTFEGGFDPANGDDNRSQNDVTTFLAPGYASVRQSDGTVTVASHAFGIAAADGTITYTDDASQVGALADAAGDGATVTFYGAVDSHPSITFNKRVTVVGEQTDADVTFNGTLRINASDSTVQGVHFLQDAADLTFKGAQYVSGVTKSVVVSNRADGVKVTGNSFTIPSVTKGNVDYTADAIWLENGVTNTLIEDNDFKIGRVHNNSAVGINIVGGGTAVDRTTVNNNRFVVTPTASGVTSGSVMFVVANGNTPAEDAYGVTNLTVTNNTVDGTELRNRSYGLSIGDVKGLTVNNNTFTNLYIGLSYSTWGATYGQGGAFVKLPASSADITLDGNTFTDNAAAVYFAANQVVDGKIVAVEVVPTEEIAIPSINVQTPDVSAYRSEGSSREPGVTPAGLAFAGWYKDKSYETPLEAGDVTGAAYARYVPKASLTAFAPSLDAQYLNGKPNYARAGLRFGYTVLVPTGATYLPGSSYWTVKLAGSSAAGAKIAAKNYVANDDGSFTTNYVLKLPSKFYENNYDVRLTIVYTTADGTVVSVPADDAQQQSVLSAAEATKDADWFAANLLDWYAKQ